MKRKSIFKSFFVPVFLLSLIYVIMGNTRSVHDNPFIPGAVIALNMIVIVFAGLTRGVRIGAGVGLFGTGLNTMIYFFFAEPTYFYFELLAIVPHMIMGATAGYLKDRLPFFFSSLSIIVGHVLNIGMYITFGLLQFGVLYSPIFLKGILYEIFIGVIGLAISVGLYHFVEGVFKDGS